MSTPGSVPASYLGFTGQVMLSMGPAGLSAALGAFGTPTKEDLEGLPQAVNAFQESFSRLNPNHELLSVLRGKSRAVRSVLESSALRSSDLDAVTDDYLLPFAFVLRRIREGFYNDAVRETIPAISQMKPRVSADTLIKFFKLRQPPGLFLFTRLNLLALRYRLTRQFGRQAEAYRMWGDWLNVGGKTKGARKAFEKEGETWLHSINKYLDAISLGDRLSYYGEEEFPSLVALAFRLFQDTEDAFQRGGVADKAETIRRLEGELKEAKKAKSPYREFFRILREARDLSKTTLPNI